MDSIKDAGERLGGRRPLERQKPAGGIRLRELWPAPDARTAVETGRLAPRDALMYRAIWDNLRRQPVTETVDGIDPAWWQSMFVAGVTFMREVWEHGAPVNLDGLERQLRDHLLPMARNEAERRYAEYAIGKGRMTAPQHPLDLPPALLMRINSLTALGWPDDPVVRDDDPHGIVQVAEHEEPSLNGFYAAVAHGRQVRLLSSDPHKTYDAAAHEAHRFMRLAQFKNGLVDESGRPLTERPSPLSNFVRIGPDWRKGKDATTRDILETFGYRGIEFGRWLTQADRQAMLNMAFDALMDLSDLFHLPTRFFSVNGLLGLAFGSRGQGRRSGAADFDREAWVIGFTKTHPFGSLVHEFAHAHDASMFVRNYGAPVPLQEGVDRVGRLQMTVDYPMVEYMSQVMYMDMDRPNRLAEPARVMNGKSPRLPATLPSFRALVEAMYDTRSAQSYGSRSAKMDNMGQDYWTQPSEMFARAMEAWVADELELRGRRNDFLVPAGLALAQDAMPGYPVGTERPWFASLFRRYFAEVGRMVKASTGAANLSRKEAGLS